MKGNLIENGDFEIGTLDGWTVPGTEIGNNDGEVSIITTGVYHGSYSCRLVAPLVTGYNYKGYNKLIKIGEEYAALFINFAIKKGTIYGVYPLMGFYEDSGKFFDYISLDYSGETEWTLFTGVIPILEKAESVKIFMGGFATAVGQDMYFDDVVIKGIQDLRSFNPTRYKYYSAKTATFITHLHLMMPAPFKIRYRYSTTGTTGTSPTLNIEIGISEPHRLKSIQSLMVPQITENGDYFGTFVSDSGGWVYIIYTIGGTSPSFNIFEHLMFSTL
jgi:hypothetical protein